MQAAAGRAKKKRNGNYEGDSGGEEEYYVAPSSGKRGRISGSGSDSNKVGSKRSQAIAKYRRGKSFNNNENGSNQNSGGQNLQAQGQG